MTPKQELFVEEYLVDLNAKQAAIRAGYSKKSAEVIGHGLLKKSLVAAAVSARRAKLVEKTRVTQERILAEYAKIGFSDVRKLLGPGGELLDPQEWDDDIAGAVSSLEVVSRGNEDEDGNRVPEHVHKIKTWDKTNALEKMAKHLGMFVERHELTGKDGGPIETKLTDLELARRVAFIFEKGIKNAD